jgi:hypothetical protein
MAKNETKHTPGPWTVRDNKNGTLGIDAKEPDGTYCQPARVNGDADDPVYGPTTRANARLIAAAPDLLAACKEWAEIWQPGMKHTKHWMRLVDAINKAEGGVA